MAEAVLQGGAKARSSLRRRPVGELVAKAPRDYQTEIDVAVERIIVDALSTSFPSYAIKGEGAVGNRNAKDGVPIIYIDPIDGTTNFDDERVASASPAALSSPLGSSSGGIPHFGMTISIVEDAEIVAGVVYDAMLDELFSAELGGGSYLNGERIRCVSSKGIEDVLVGAGLPIPGQLKAVPEEIYFSALKRLMATTAGVRRLGSAASSIAYVACGRLDGFSRMDCHCTITAPPPGWCARQAVRLPLSMVDPSPPTETSLPAIGFSTPGSSKVFRPDHPSEAVPNRPGHPS